MVALIALLLDSNTLFVLMFFASLVTLLNFIPFLKYDGYWILVDYYDIPNLLKYATDYILYKVRIINVFKPKVFTARQSKFFYSYVLLFCISIVALAILVAYNLYLGVLALTHSASQLDMQTVIAACRVLFGCVVTAKLVQVLIQSIGRARINGEYCHSRWP
jgi:putative peptide zinc metalloprotease protein